MSSKYTTLKTDEIKTKWSTNTPIDNIRNYPRRYPASNELRKSSK